MLKAARSPEGQGGGRGGQTGEESMSEKTGLDPWQEGRHQRARDTTWLWVGVLIPESGRRMGCGPSKTGCHMPRSGGRLGSSPGQTLGACRHCTRWSDPRWSCR